MKSKTSFCNITVIKKDITRFWPLWVIIFLALQFFGNITLYFNMVDIKKYADQPLKELQQSVLMCVSVFSNPLLISGMAIISAVLVFGYLKQRVSAYTIHSLPLRRETLFVSHFLSGFLMLAVPYLLTFFVTGGINMAFGAGMGKAITAVFLETFIILFFFYSMACLVAMVSGDGVLSVIIYGVLNGLVIGIRLLFESIQMAFYGMTDNMSAFGGIIKYLTPIYYFASVTGKRAGYASMTRLLDIDGWYGMSFNRDVTEFRGEIVGQCAIYLLPACLMVVAAWVLYRKRPLENVGDSVAFSWCHVIFRIVFSVCGGMLLEMLIEEIVGTSLNYKTMYVVQLFLLAFACAVNFLIADMILKKKFKVFKEASYLQMGIICICMVVCVFVSRQIYLRDSIPSGKDASLRVDFCGVTFMYPAGEIPEEAYALQREIMERGVREPVGNQWELQGGEAGFYYTLPNGKQISRSYFLSAENNSEMLSKLQDFFNQKENREQYLLVEQLDSQYMVSSDIYMEYLEKSYSSEELTVAVKERFLDALKKDIKEGNLKVANWNYYYGRMEGNLDNSVSYVYIVFILEENKELSKKFGGSYFQQEFLIDEGCIYTQQVLKDIMEK